MFFGGLFFFVVLIMFLNDRLFFVDNLVIIYSFCVYVCVCEKWRENERGRERESERVVVCFVKRLVVMMNYCYGIIYSCFVVCF